MHLEDSLKLDKLIHSLPFNKNDAINIEGIEELKTALENVSKDVKYSAAHCLSMSKCLSKYMVT